MNRPGSPRRHPGRKRKPPARDRHRPNPDLPATDRHPDRSEPWVELRTTAYRTLVYRKMLTVRSPDATPGACVSVYDRDGHLFGHALFNPYSNIALRMLNFDDNPVDDAFWRERIRQAVTLRDDLLKLPARTDACRLIHAEGDGLSGLVVDRYQDLLSISVYSKGIWDHRETWLPALLDVTRTGRYRITVDDTTLELEKIQDHQAASNDFPDSVTILENGLRYALDFATGHKTGFFCDQRDNRAKLATMTAGRNVLDLCCYSGGFGITAKTVGDAADVTCVDLDENAVAMAKRNANLNQVRVDTVHADAFTYMRQMADNGRRFGTVVLDPPKLVFGKKDLDDGTRKYRDMNRLAAGLVEPGGLFLTCSCSGALQRDEFIHLAVHAVRHAGRSCQILDVTGAGPDHPVHPHCPESAYLKAVWLRVH